MTRLDLPYRMVEVTAADPLYAEVGAMDADCFPHRMPWLPAAGDSVFVVTDLDHNAVAYACLSRFRGEAGVGYLSRAGVMPTHRGRGLQGWLIVARERKAIERGYRALVSNTNPENIHSANNLWEAGFRLYRPEVLFDGDGRLYFRKELA